MGIAVEFNPELALRSQTAYESGARCETECLPVQLQEGQEYRFAKRGQRNFYLQGAVPLRETADNEAVSRPLASITIVEATHVLRDGEPWTIGRYRVDAVFTDDGPHFEGFEMLA
jgi:hypothetical protein